MKEKALINILKYWRNTLADAARVEIDVSKAINLLEADIDYTEGKVNAEQTRELIAKAEKKHNESKGRLNKKDPDWEFLDEVTVLLAPFGVSPKPEYTKLSGEKGIFYPFWIRAILSLDGRLKQDEDTFPYIPRAYLEPQVNQDINYVFSDVEKVDLAFGKPFQPESGWPPYWKYILDIFEQISGGSLDNYGTENFIATFSTTIVVNDSLAGPSDAIIGLYDYLIKEKESVPLLGSLAERRLADLKELLQGDEFERASGAHLGQMGYEFPLSISQRKSLYHHHTLHRGDVLAVNGPPGTGKTTLLQSVVASEVVNSAVRGETPAVIVACSSNNQAVTNIIDSFAGVKKKQGTLYERWLPGLTGFGLYLPSQRKEVPDHIPFIKRQGGLIGGHIDKESDAYLDRAEAYFMERFGQHMGWSVANMEDALQYIRQEILKTKELLENGMALWHRYRGIARLVKKLDPSLQDRLFGNFELDEVQLDNIGADLKRLEKDVSDYLDREPFWIKLFSFFAFVKEKRAMRLKQIFRECPLPYDAIDFYKIKTFHPFFDEKLDVIDRIKKISQQWKNWKQRLGLKGNPPMDDDGFRDAERTNRPFFYDELEKGAKYDLFHLAVHYWEAKWVVETRSAMINGDTQRNGAEAAKNRWRRFAMLTPCFVSTFYMAPRFFTYSKFIGKDGNNRNIYESPPLVECIDLLIVDEAGQVSPEVGAATFALAKKALVVGDVKQIEPVWNVPEKVDFGNLLKFEIIDSLADERTVSDLKDKGFFSSSGSIMKLAQKTSNYQLRAGVERGMLLTEHRRCFDEIIGYCNKLAYDGMLEPKKGPARDTLFAPMGFVDVAGSSKVIGASRGNPDEATAIARWIAEHESRIIEHYQLKENNDAQKDKRPAKVLRLADLIAVVTPFVGQKFTLRSLLRKAGIDISGLTIGTVHALQGAERPIVLFSSTYGTNDIGKGYFFDRGVNMLNVAVSRAKDCLSYLAARRCLTGEETVLLRCCIGIFWEA